MSKKHPIIAVTGSSGAGTTFVTKAFKRIFTKKKLNVVVIEGDSFHKFERDQMKKEVIKSRKKNGVVLTHFSKDANHFDRLVALFKQYGKDATGKKRYYIHSQEEALAHNQRLGTNLKPGQFTPWEYIKPQSDLMFYEGLHGGVKTAEIDVADEVDLLVGVAPSVNIEWIQKIYRDTTERLYTPEQVVATILDRMPDYAEFITPQFERTHINFHRVPLIDTTNPFAKQNVPAPEDSLIIISTRINDINLKNVKNSLPKTAMAHLQNEKTLVCLGSYIVDIMDKLFTPIITKLIHNQFLL